jgi:hypothetical protein
MDLLYLILALGLPLLLGTGWLQLFTPNSLPGRWPLLAGYGALLGLLGITVLMRLIDACGFPLSIAWVGSVSGILALAAIVTKRFTDPVNNTAAMPDFGFCCMSYWHKLLFSLFFALISLRLLTLGLELIWRPLFPWDATMHWATKAKVWFHTAGITPFVEPDLWLKMGGEGVFSDHHPEYPQTIPLLQTWVNLALGRWDESLMNLPWLLCYAALGCMFYGQARVAGVGALTALIFTYMLMSMPLINVHVALAGYADLFLGTCYVGALMAFHNWSQNKERWQGALALLLAGLCMTIKNEGFYWFLSFIPALIVVSLSLRKSLFFLLLLPALVVAVLWMFPEDINVAGHSLGQLALSYRPNALSPILTSFAVFDNWHLFTYLLLCLVPLAFLSNFHRYLGIGAALTSAVGLLLTLFLFTKFAYGAVYHSSLGRISLHLVPSVMFLIMLAYHEVCESGSSPDNSTAETENLSPD